MRGVYLQGNEAVRPGVRGVDGAVPQPGHDHAVDSQHLGAPITWPFDEVGLPGFQFIQDPVEYGTHSHHTNMDVFDRLQAEDLMKNAVIVASFAYHTANREALLPRKAAAARARRTVDRGAPVAVTAWNWPSSPQRSPPCWRRRPPTP